MGLRNTHIVSSINFSLLLDQVLGDIKVTTRCCPVQRRSLVLQSKRRVSAAEFREYPSNAIRPTGAKVRRMLASSTELTAAGLASTVCLTMNNLPSWLAAEMLSELDILAQLEYGVVWVADGTRAWFWQKASLNNCFNCNRQITCFNDVLCVSTEFEIKDLVGY